MDIQEVVTVSSARAQLPQILAGLAAEGPAAAPVVIGAHRKPQGVLLSVALYEELTAARRREAVASAAGSLRAEGLHASSAAEADADDYAHGRITADELVERAANRYRAPLNDGQDERPLRPS
ncbi:type II toxin-antitoxin system Phd/YefM family antitoxin [Kitasatospora sp. NPDC051853]|uniref:antitoxin VbhA family protein n=1 Tax=Kitasatospora sp. NPDC051853 TaxID=3364058 RepID=UPI0037A4A2F2